MEKCDNGLPYYMQHMIWSPNRHANGLGGDQIPMALSSWNLLYGYLGDEAVKQNMIYMADYWLDHGLSKPSDPWPNLIYPYDTVKHSAAIDGDMVAGKGVLQPDKAASFAAELVVLYKMTGNQRYLDAAVKMADVLAKQGKPGDSRELSVAVPGLRRNGADGAEQGGHRVFRGAGRRSEHETEPPDRGVVHDQLDRRAAAVRRAAALRKGNGAAYLRARDMSDRVAEGLSTEELQVGSVFRGRADGHVVGHGDQRRHDGMVHPGAPGVGTRSGARRRIASCNGVTPCSPTASGRTSARS